MDLTVTEGTPVRDGFLVIDIERFQGPLDLLLHLIRTQDIEIFDIPIAKITDQFLHAIRGLEVDDLDGAGEFLEMAATLIHIKAQMLLPRSVDEEDEAAADAAEDDKEGCGCSSTARSAHLAWAVPLMGLIGLRRRRA